MPNSYHSGAEGVVVAAGTDWQVQSWEATITANSQPTTNTSNFNPTTKQTWTQRFETTTDASGTFEFIFDSNNDPTVGSPTGPLAQGNVVPASFQKTSGKTLSGNIFIDSIAIRSGGMEGLFTVTVNWHNQGEMTWS